MRAKEFIREATKYRKSADKAIPGAQLHDHGINDAYSLYRFGVALAGSPDRPGDVFGPTKGQATITLAYSDADQAIIDKTAKVTGAVTRQLTSKGSRESNTVNTQSPVANLGPVKRKS
jgi:hypothetical protein